MAEHAGKSLDELISLKVINADQKAQIQKKPALQSQLAQLEESLAQHKKIDQEYRVRISAERAELERVFADKYEKEKAEAVAEAKEAVEAAAKKELQDSLLIVSQFLALAAQRRAEDVDQSDDENMALEGVLLSIYAGDASGVVGMQKLVRGEDEPTKSVAGVLLATTCKLPDTGLEHPT